MSEQHVYTIDADNESRRLNIALTWSEWPNMLAVGVFLIVGVLIFATFQDYGVSWDEMLQNTYGIKLLQYYTSGFDDLSAFNYSNLYLYGGFFDLIAALLNKVSPFGMYETRHLLGGLIFLAGLIVAWRLVHLLAGSRAALIAVVCLATTPLLYGHSFINPKDSPLAWLLVWVIYFGCRILCAPERASIATIAGFGISLGLALGTRVIAVAFPAYVAAVLCFSMWVQNVEARRAFAVGRQAWIYARPLVAAAPAALVLMAVFWPWSVQSPLNLLQAAEIFSNFSWHPIVLWSGQLLQSTDLPPNYVTRILFFQLPEYVLIGCVLATLAGAAALYRGGLHVFSTGKGRSFLFLALAALVPIVAFMIMRPVAYNGLRHFLFVVPPLVILSAIGLERAMSYLTARGTAWMVAGWIVLCFGWGCQIVTMTRVHPYQYVAYNALIDGIRGAENRFELDYWGTSLAEASRGLADFVVKNHATDGGKKTKVFVCGDRTSAEYFLPKNIEVTDRLSLADFYMAINDPPCRYHFDNPGKAIFQVQREGVTLSYVLDIRLPPGTQTDQ